MDKKMILAKRGMHNIMDNEKRHCTPTESLTQSLKEMRLMRAGKMKKRTWNEYIKEEAKIDKESEEPLNMARRYKFRKGIEGFRLKWLKK